MKHAFPDLQAHVEDIFAAQDKVAVRLRLRGTHSGEFLGFAPTGRTVESVSHEFVYQLVYESRKRGGGLHRRSSRTWPVRQV